jgi:hypothetical protein
MVNFNQTDTSITLIMFPILLNHTAWQVIQVTDVIFRLMVNKF